MHRWMLPSPYKGSECKRSNGDRKPPSNHFAVSTRVKDFFFFSEYDWTKNLGKRMGRREMGRGRVGEGFEKTDSFP